MSNTYRTEKIISLINKASPQQPENALLLNRRFLRVKFEKNPSSTFDRFRVCFLRKSGTTDFRTFVRTYFQKLPQFFVRQGMARQVFSKVRQIGVRRKDFVTNSAHELAVLIRKMF